ncbi:MAG: pimeloyl-ACP methyl ester carboxylesterase [Saprospiraceae bacterium]|jgi:pimeloyl-ACP methyl ester carboxylesterase
MVQKIQKIVLKGKSNRNVVADLTYPLSMSFGKKTPIVIFCHGFKGFKDWGHFNLMAEKFAKNGFAFLKFNYSHNGGTVIDPIDFPDLEAFGENDFIKEMEDMEVVLDAFFDSSQLIFGKSAFDDLLPSLDVNNISMIGHSRGGGMVAIFCAAEKRIKKIILMAAVSDFEARQPAPEVMSHWKEYGVIHVENGRTKQQMPMYYNFVEVFEANKELLNIESACKKITQQTHVIQGIADEVVPSEEAEDLISWLEKASFLFVENGDHVFGSSHPYDGDTLPGQTSQVILSSIDFLKRPIPLS